MPRTRDITPKQFLYALKRVEGLSTHEAYVIAYKPKTQSLNSLYSLAAKVEANPRVQAAIKQRQEEVAAASKITAERVIQEIAKLAFDDTGAVDLTNKNRALDMLAKCTGSYKPQTIAEGTGALVFCLDGKKPESQPKNDLPESPRSHDLSQGNMIPFPKTAESST